MEYHAASHKLAAYRERIAALRSEMRKVQEAVEPQQVDSYSFDTMDGPVTLADLFVIHNMGTSCPYCTMWADGFNGVIDHLQSRAAFVLTSPDPPAAQQAFRTARGWKFRMVSHQGNGFAADMGYRSDKGCQPGISVFRKLNGAIVRVSDAALGPGDDFCTVWHFLDLLPAGAGEWEPDFTYRDAG